MSNSNYNLSIQCDAYTNLGEDHFSTSLNFDPYNDCTDIDGLKELARTQLVEENEGIDFDGCEIDFDFSNADWSGVPEKWQSLEKIFEFAEAFAECSYEIEVVEAALECGIQGSDIDEAYQGEYKDNEDFAQEMADSLGAIDKNATWPMNCIDWEFAAKELMYDYFEENGYYFRNL